ncbi:MAG: 1-(5-phosphoribosyl)-5-[(5-phosphoribosylamino)methylideneamino]imidazole-4-carboxamide isomerase [Candidatus Omnitrophica bacterium]|nr:1-(5-phosphoribosyl)-5-[(5-phosphoribosylamino)methylideneamino]imidazole-4-carboxamide isomerase [Candidatus Omnitrophota bacterium]
MLIIPAIDIIQGKVVRLHQGDFNKITFYSDEPIKIAMAWQEKGARLLHLVDLEGARDGKLKNKDTIVDIVKNIDILCEIGGGIRTESDIEFFLNTGAKRVVIGTKALEGNASLGRLVSKYKEKIVVSIDFSGGRVAKKGWQEETDLTPGDCVDMMQEAGVKTIVVTDIRLDGTLKGPNVKRIKEIINSKDISVIASGGISSIEDIRKLKEIENKNLEGVIVGRALYEGKVKLEEAIKIAEPTRN